MSVIADIFQGGVQGVLGGINDLIKTFKLPAEDAAKFQQQTQELLERQFEAMLADVNSARQMEMATKSKTPEYLSAISVIGFFGILALVIFYTIPTSVMPTVSILLGYLGAMVQSVFQFYFGSSQGSQQKDQMLKDLHSTLIDNLGKQ